MTEANEFSSRVPVTESQLGKIADDYVARTIAYMKDAGRLSLAYYGTEENMARTMRATFLRHAGERFVITPDAEPHQQDQERSFSPP